MYKTWACSCAHTHVFVSHRLVGSMPGLPQSLTEETEDSPSWAVFYQLYRITMQTAPSLWYLLHFQHAPDSLVSISKIPPVIPCLPLLFHPGTVNMVNYQHAAQGGQEKMAVMGCEVDNRGNVSARLLLRLLTRRKVEDARLVRTRQVELVPYVSEPPGEIKLN